ncbi:MAG: hypothetical protein UU93_C0003G0011 [Candidatus Amesbacteria bacterium GW2011_GWA2_42_12]|uniref:Type II toxin-antitoxin system HicB family antitoxin n=1 Tax=Candidatus Amesbacteria bacterium GW2011_GWA2_42_12 TaxID=1618356 RepID=A0A0G1B633_9BACT|nr:MAG: hypothetical protein UU93_C0003G0011 [Candidatus Amesbacteria bacterium GW2011_GWA2_42_12]
MAQTKLEPRMHALVWKEGKIFVAKCVEVEVASQGNSQSEALANLREALELYFEDDRLRLPSLSNLELFPLKIGYA